MSVLAQYVEEYIAVEINKTAPVCPVLLCHQCRPPNTSTAALISGSWEILPNLITSALVLFKPILIGPFNQEQTLASQWKHHPVDCSAVQWCGGENGGMEIRTGTNNMCGVGWGAGRGRAGQRATHQAPLRLPHCAAHNTIVRAWVLRPAVLQPGCPGAPARPRLPAPPARSPSSIKVRVSRPVSRSSKYRNFIQPTCWPGCWWRPRSRSTPGKPGVTETKRLGLCYYWFSLFT